MAGPGAQAFKTLAGVTPCPAGWLVLPARLAGVTTVAEEAFVVKTLADVLDYRPKFDFGAVNIPFGYPEYPNVQYRPADRAARAMMGWPTRVHVHPVPSRAALFARNRKDALAIEPWLTRNDFRHFKWMREAAREIQPFHHVAGTPATRRSVVPAHERRRAAPHERRTTRRVRSSVSS
jgi:predicted RNase H-like nuclease